jgi:hypothetical protein
MGRIRPCVLVQGALLAYRGGRISDRSLGLDKYVEALRAFACVFVDRPCVGMVHRRGSIEVRYDLPCRCGYDESGRSPDWLGTFAKQLEYVCVEAEPQRADQMAEGVVLSHLCLRDPVQTAIVVRLSQVQKEMLQRQHYPASA